MHRLHNRHCFARSGFSACDGRKVSWGVDESIVVTYHTVDTKYGPVQTAAGGEIFDKLSRHSATARVDVAAYAYRVKLGVILGQFAVSWIKRDSAVKVVAANKVCADECEIRAD